MIDLRAGKKGSGDPSFDAIVGQAELKEALLAVVTNSDLDGLLVQGEKGTAKSTAVRALAALLPSQRVIEDCPFGCPPGNPPAQCTDCRDRTEPPVETRPVPLVTLPLGATREQVVGTLSVSDALEGNTKFDPGVLARANRGILYVDEVNLLDDHLVDVLLDAAASGINRVERDGVSVTHPAEFTLIGTMNPEEGDLRPQLRDRFALQATVTGCEAIEERVAIIDTALGNGEESAQTGEQSTDRSTEIREQITTAMDRLETVSLSDDFKEQIAQLCRDSGLDGHRGDIAIARGARTFAALDAREQVIETDIEQAARLALPHRLTSRPFEDAPDPSEIIDEQFSDTHDGENGSGEVSGDGTEDQEGQKNTEDGSRERSESEQEETTCEDPSDPTSETGEHTSEPTNQTSGAPAGDSGQPEQAAGTCGSSASQGDQSNGDHSQGGESGGDTAASESDGSESEQTLGSSPTADSELEAGGNKSSARSPSDDSVTAEPGTQAADGAELGDKSEEQSPIVPGQTATDVSAEGDRRAPELDLPEITGRPSGDTGSGRSQHESPAGDGAKVRTESASHTDSIDAAASIRSASRRGSSVVESTDLRKSVRTTSSSALVVFVVDASASMRPAMRAAKGTLLELLKESYQQRDEVAFITFAGDSADVLLPPTESVTLAARHLKALPTGDRTPLPEGLRTATTVLERAEPDRSVVVLVTDGKSNASSNPVAETTAAARQLATQKSTVLVVDAGSDDRANLIQTVCEATDGRRVPIEALTAARVDAAVGSTTD